MFRKIKEWWIIAKFKRRRKKELKEYKKQDPFNYE